MSSVSTVARVPRLPDRPVRAVAVVGREWADARVADVDVATDVAARALRGPVGGPSLADVYGRARGSASTTVGRGAYAERAYRAADALRPRAVGDVEVEVAVRTLADGGRVAVARRLAGGATVGIEAQIA